VIRNKLRFEEPIGRLDLRTATFQVSVIIHTTRILIKLA
jgi:hypothetical protein